MKHLPLLFANLKRKKIRTTLTIGSFLVALFLFGVLASIRAGFNQGIEVAGADRLVVIGKISLMQLLPISYMAKIARIPGVQAVTHSTWFGGIYQEPRNFFPQFAIDPEQWRAMYPEFVLDEGQWKDFLADRQGVVVGRALAKRFGWKIGDHVPLKSPGYLGGDSWDFNVRAIYRGRRPNDDESQFWLQHKYFYEKAPIYFRGNVGWFVVRVANPDESLRVAKAIDAEFANSTGETRTQTESAFAAAFVKQMGNIEFLILAIGSIVFFTLLLVTGNTMAISVRERTGELAVLKAIGYSDRFVLGLVLAESLLIAAIGGGDRARAGARRRRTGHHARPAAHVPAGPGHRRGRRGRAHDRPRRGPAARVLRHAPERGRRLAEGLIMAIPIAYNLRSARERWSSSVVAVLGIAGTVGVFVAMLALAHGFKATMASSGLPENAIVQRGGADNEMTSILTLADVRVIEDAPQVARNGNELLVSPEVVVIAAIPLRETGTDANVSVRGVQPRAMQVRRQLSLVEGRFLTPGLAEAVVGRGAQRAYTGLDLGATVKIGAGTWKIVGVFDGKGTAFDSEVWADANVLDGFYQRPVNIFQSVTARLKSGERLSAPSRPCSRAIRG